MRMEQWCLPSQANIRHVGALLLWGWLNTYVHAEVVNKFLVLICLYMELLLYL